MEMSAQCARRLVNLVRKHSSISPVLRNWQVPLTRTPVYTLTTDVPREKLIIDESAVVRLKEILDKDEFLRVLVEGGGCSGFQYKFEVDKEVDMEEDVTFDTDGGKVVCDGVSLKILNGATLEFHKDMLRAGFRIVDIPQAEKGCSCGVSFSMKL